MAHPTSYTKSYDFAGFQANNARTPLPATEVDTELTNIQTAVASNRAAIMDVRRSDGRLKNEIVTYDALTPQLRTAFEAPAPTLQTDWGPDYSFQRYCTDAEWAAILLGDSTDNYAARLQEAEDDVNAKGGGTIRYPAGVIPVDCLKGANASYNSGIRGALYIKGGVHHVGVPGKTIWRNIADGWTSMVSIRQGTDFGFDGIIFDGSRYSHPNALLASNTIRGELMIFWNQTSTIERVTIRNCGFKNSGHYAMGFAAACDDVLIDGNWCYDIGGDFIDIKEYPNFSKKGYRIVNNIARRIGTNWQERVADLDGPQAAFDIRGAAVVANNIARDIDTYDVTQLGNDAFRAAPDVASDGTGRIGGNKARFANNWAHSAKLVGEGSGTTKRTRGLVISASSVSVMGFYAENFMQGCSVTFNGNGGEGAQRSILSGLHLRNCRGAAGDGIGLRLSSDGNQCRDHYVHAVIEDSDLGWQCSTSGTHGHLFFSDCDQDHDLTNATLALNPVVLKHYDTTVSDNRALNNMQYSATVWAEKDPRLMLRSTYNGTWGAPYKGGGITVTAEDANVVGTDGEVGAIDFNWAGSSGANGGWLFRATDGADPAMQDILYARYDRVDMYVPLVLADGNVPASASATGIKGQTAFDGSYVYICTATDTWKRVAIATW